MPLSRKSLVFLCWMLCTAFICCQGETGIQKHLIKLTADSDGKTVTLKKGNSFILKLDNNVDGGYHFDGLAYNRLLLKMVKHTSTLPAPQSGLGNHGTDTWYFKALKIGRSELNMTASRPWKHSDTLKIFAGIIIIK